MMMMILLASEQESQGVKWRRVAVASRSPLGGCLGHLLALEMFLSAIAGSELVSGHNSLNRVSVNW